MTLDDYLSELVRRAVREEVSNALAELTVSEPRPELRESDAMARELSISRSTLDRLVNRGLPYIRVGDVRRFRTAEVMAWLEEQQAGRYEPVA